MGICGSVLQWFRSYLTNRSFCVSIYVFCSTSVTLPWRYHKAPFLVLFYFLYLLPLGAIFQKHNISFLLSSSKTQCDVVKHGVILILCGRMDPTLKLDSLVKAVVKSYFLQLRRLSEIKPFLSKHKSWNSDPCFYNYSTWLLWLFFPLKKLGLHGPPTSHANMARFLTGISKWEHITPTLAFLHCLSVHFRIQF